MTARDVREKSEAKKPGHGAGSFGRNSLSAPITGSKADEKAALILKAACLLNDYEKQHNCAADDDALKFAFDGMAEFLKAEDLNGLRFAIELHDWLSATEHG
jgi:hypothetical protein